jgi:D-alanyl-D-alanine carboxypeptidase (penicillin-binding protein 5/6)
MTRTTQIQIFLLVLIVGFLTGPRILPAIEKFSPRGGMFGAKNSPQLASPVLPSELTAPTTTAPIVIDPYAELDLEAKGVYVWDIKTHRKLYGQNEHTVLPLASVTKMMMALVASEILAPDVNITILPDDLMEEGDTGLYVGEKWSLSELLRFTLVSSSNDGASAIAGVAGAALVKNGMETGDPFTNKKLFIEKMNQKAKEIGLTNTHFGNVTGLDIESVASGAYGTPRDMSTLFEYILKNHPELFTATAYEKTSAVSSDNITHRVANTNAGVAHMIGLIGSKTGYTDFAGGNLVVIVDIGIDHPVVIVALGSTRDGRFTDVKKLIDATVEEITLKPGSQLPELNSQS